MNFSHTKNQYLTSFKNKNNFIFFKKIKKFKSDPIPEFIKIVENNNFSFLYESVEKGKEKGRYSICGYNTIKTIQIDNRKETKEKKLYSKNKNAFLTPYYAEHIRYEASNTGNFLEKTNEFISKIRNL